MAPLESSPATTVGLHAFDLLLRVLTVLLAAGTMAAVPLLALFLTGRGPIAVSAQLEPPYSIGLYDDRVLEITHFGRPSAYVNFPIGEESKYLKASPRVVADVHVGTDDTDTRVVISAAAVALLTIAWSGVMNLWRVVRSAGAGNPFSTRNVIRLRWLAGSVLAMPLVAEVATRLIDRTLDVDPPVSVMTPGPGWPALLIVGLGLVALSEVFGSGSELRKFEEETI